MEPMPIGPSATKLWVTAVACLVFAIGMFAMMGDSSDRVGQYLGVIFGPLLLAAGIGLGYRARHLQPLLTLTYQGIQHGWGGMTPWSDIAHVGTGKLKSGPKFAGIIMSDYTNYLCSLPDGYEERARKYAWVGTALGLAVLPANMNVQSVAEAALTDAKTLVNWDVVSVPKRGVAKQLLWARGQQDGYDIVWVQAALPQSAEATVKIILEYWTSASQSPAGRRPRP